MMPRFEWPALRRGLSRIEAAMYLGISASKFDELVARRPNAWSEAD